MPGHVDHGQGEVVQSTEQDEEFTVNVIVTKKTGTRTVVTQPTQPPAAKLNWSTDPPPPYETPNRNESGELPSQNRRSGARREWDKVATRIAARTGAARQATKRFSRGENPNRVSKSSGKRHNPGLSIDTSVTKHLGAPPLLLPKGERRRSAAGYNKIQDTANIAPTTANSYAQNARGEAEAVPGFQLPNKEPMLPFAYPTDLGINLVSKFSPETPTIVITPALASGNSGHSKLPGFRGASSIYSRGTLGASFAVDNTTVPAFPNNLPYLLERSQPLVHEVNPRDSSATAFEEDVDDKKIGRITSSGTLFEEDHTLLTAPIWAANKRENLTIDTTALPTPDRANGWWDFIRTPFERSVSKYFKSPTDSTKSPDVPPVPQNAYLAGAMQEKTQAQNNPKSLGDDYAPAPYFRDLKPLPRVTHNSQALRNLESNERLTTEPLPNQSKAARESAYSTFSPNDREVPVVLSMGPMSAIQQNNNPFKTNQDEKPQMDYTHKPATSPLVGNATLSPNQEQSPASSNTDFSPIMQIAAVGTVLSAKGVVNDPKAPVAIPAVHTKTATNPSVSSTSLRSSFSAEIVKQTPPTSYQPQAWQQMYFAPQPVSSQREAPLSRQQVLDAPPPQYPPARFSEYTTPPEKPKQNRVKQLLCCRRNKKPKDVKKKKKKKKTWCCCCFCLLFLILVGVAIALAVILSRKHPTSTSSLPQPPQSTAPIFLTVTNFPPVPTGALTIARPNLRTSVSGCVEPKTMWSCAVPKEQQASIAPNDPDQPNFAFDIKYDNSSASAPQRFKIRRTSSGVYATSWARRNLLHLRRAMTGTTFQPSPAPPTLEEQAFLGNTTDGNVSPFEGEETPFFISFKPPSSSSNNKIKRQDSGSTTASSASSATTSANDFPVLATAIPIPETNPDGTAEPANLLPFPAYQPLRLYNRGTLNEHYGFYTYFERNIFLKSVQSQNASDVPADLDGGSTFDSATQRCTWRETRFKVQIWTNKGNSAQLLPAPSGTAPPKPGATTQSFARPGTFPYPVTVTLDRHGGGLERKMLFCIGLDDRGHFNLSSRQFQREDRAFGGQLVNPALGPFTFVNVTHAQGGPGGIDGGTGGCSCEWANWLSK